MSDLQNVVWIVYDSVRADHSSVCGYDRPTTPNLERIASRESGATFSNATAHAIWSLPSTASILTGTSPSYHGTGLENDVLPDTIPTVPERLSEAGVTTAGLSGNSYFTEETGLDRGFDEFTHLRTVPLGESNVLSVAGLSTVLRFIANLGEHGGGYTLDSRRHSANYLVNEVAKRQLSDLGEADEPFFYYAHFPGAHHPYAPPKPYRDRFFEAAGLSPEAAEFALEHTTDVYREIADGCAFTEPQRTAIRAAYDACVAYVDSLAGDLFDHVRETFGDDTVVVMTSDHGDLLGEHGLLGHKVLLHDALVNVPLVADGLPGVDGRRTDPAQHTDVMYTLLSALDVGVDGIDGIDLRERERPFAVSQRGDRTCRNTIQKLTEYEGSVDTDWFPRGLVTALRTDGFKLVESDQGRRLYDLPDESTDASAAFPDERERLDDALDDWLAAHQERVASSAASAFSEGTKQRLRDLGYVVD